MFKVSYATSSAAAKQQQRRRPPAVANAATNTSSTSRRSSTASSSAVSTTTASSSSSSSSASTAQQRRHSNNNNNTNRHVDPSSASVSSIASSSTRGTSSTTTTLVSSITPAESSLASVITTNEEEEEDGDNNNFSHHETNSVDRQHKRSYGQQPQPTTRPTTRPPPPPPPPSINHGNSDKHVLPVAASSSSSALPQQQQQQQKQQSRQNYHDEFEGMKKPLVSLSSSAPGRKRSTRQRHVNFSRDGDVTRRSRHDDDAARTATTTTTSESDDGDDGESLHDDILSSVALTVYCRNVFSRMIVAAGTHRARRVADHFHHTVVANWNTRRRLLWKWRDRLFEQRLSRVLEDQQLKSLSSAFSYWRKRARLNDISRVFVDSTIVRQETDLATKCFRHWRGKHIVVTRRPLVATCFKKWREKAACNYMVTRLAVSFFERCWLRWLARFQVRENLRFADQIQRRVRLWKVMSHWRETLHFRRRQLLEVTVREQFVLRQCFCRWKTRHGVAVQERHRRQESLMLSGCEGGGCGSLFAVGSSCDSSFS